MNTTTFTTILASLGIAACSSGGNGLADARLAAIDATADALVAPVDANEAPNVSVTVFDPNAQTPFVGLPVAFMNADGSAAKVTVTGADGFATAFMTAGGSVTVGATAVIAPDGDSPEPHVYTYLGVQPGDHLVISGVNPATAVVPLSVPALDNAQLYFATSTCSPPNMGPVSSTTNSSVGLVVLAGCTSADIFVEAVDNANNIFSLFVEGQSIVANTPVTLSGLYDAAIATAGTVTNLPDGTNGVDISLGLFDGSALLYGIDDNAVDFTGTSASRTISHISFPGAQQVGGVQWGTQAGNYQNYFSRNAVDEDFTVDLSVVPQLPSVTLAQFEAASSSLSWQESGGTATADLATVTMNVSSGTTRNFFWQVVGPHTSNSLTLPTLPSSLSKFNIITGDVVSPQISTIGKITGGYDRVRPAAFGVGNFIVTLEQTVGDTLQLSTAELTR